MPNAIIYTRYSPRPNAADCESCEKQEEVCRAYCMQRGYNVTAVYSDRGQSGDDADRPGLWEAVDALAPGSVLVCRWRNRLAREVYLAETVRRAVEKNKAKIEAAEETNGESPDDVFIQHILAAFAERERKYIGIRTKLAMRKYQRAGRRMGRYAPYGYVLNGQQLGINAAEQAVVMRIVDLHSQGVAPLKIAKQLAQEDVHPRTGAWTRRQIERIISNLPTA
jgi:site-specific DNA recombinase